MCQAIPESRLRLLAGHLQALGPRSVLEYVREILAGADPIERLERYAELDPAIVAAVGGHKLPPIAVEIQDSARLVMKPRP
jgi:hypothetical protein